VGLTEGQPITVTPDMVSRARDASPAELRRQLSGDLDNVLLKSLSKEPLGRYRSADQMSEDIRHHLQGEPVLATSETLFYRIGKFLQRYRIWVIAALAMAAALGTGVVTIRPVGLLYLGGALLTFGLWYAVTDRVMGRRIAESSLFHPQTLGFLGIGIGQVFPLLFPLAWVPSFAWGLGAIMLCPLVIGWLARERWAGRLLLDVLALCLILSILWRGPSPSSALPPTLLFMVLVSLGNWISRKLEIREQGIIRSGRLPR
jgi:hypothetical protein